MNLSIRTVCFLAHGLDGTRTPVIDFQDDDAALGMHDDESGCRRFGPAGMLYQVVVLKLGFKQAGEATLAGSVKFAGVEGWGWTGV